MINKKIKIPIYGWTLYYMDVVDKKYVSDLEKQLKKFKVAPDVLKEILLEIKEDGHDGGYTLTCSMTKVIVLLLFPMSSVAEKMKVLNHEKRHVEDKILENENVNCIESSALLAGYLGCELYKILI